MCNTVVQRCDNYSKTSTTKMSAMIVQQLKIFDLYYTYAHAFLRVSAYIQWKKRNKPVMSVRPIVRTVLFSRQTDLNQLQRDGSEGPEIPQFWSYPIIPLDVWLQYHWFYCSRLAGRFLHAQKYEIRGHLWKNCWKKKLSLEVRRTLCFGRI